MPGDERVTDPAELLRPMRFPHMKKDPTDVRTQESRKPMNPGSQLDG